jgi:DNA replication and repair protein RecF
MVINEISLKNFRNIEEIVFQPHEKYNLLFGENAQGKTSILEAIWLLSGCKSFRTTSANSLPRHDTDGFEISLKCTDSRRENKLELSLKNGVQTITVNGVKGDKIGLFETMQCILFTPDDIELVKGSPENRRDFLDMCLCRLSSAYTRNLRTFNGILKQRNAAIKQVLQGTGTRKVVESFNFSLTEYCGEITLQRHDYAKKLGKIASRLYKEISGENLEVIYSPNFVQNTFLGEGTIISREKLSNNCMLFYDHINSTLTHTDEVRRGHTLYGCHKDDLNILLDGRQFREFGSQGQQKSAALALKLAQAYIYQKTSPEKPVVLLDDVMGELDFRRREIVYKIVKDMQVFITTCNKDTFKKGGNFGEFEIRGGKIEKIASEI